MFELGLAFNIQLLCLKILRADASPTVKGRSFEPLKLFVNHNLLNEDQGQLIIKELRVIFGAFAQRGPNMSRSHCKLEFACSRAHTVDRGCYAHILTVNTVFFGGVKLSQIGQ